jgi:hypothetical protein
MGKGNLRFGGKSGVLPKPRPIFRRNPIRPPTAAELQLEAQHEQGYAEGVPEPKRRGMVFPRQPVAKRVVTVQERIERTIEAPRAAAAAAAAAATDPGAKWQWQKEELRRAHLHDAYVAEEQRLARAEAHKLKQEARAAEEHRAETVFEESAATKLTVPTVDLYLQGPLMRPRTEEETQRLLEQRRWNRQHLQHAAREQRLLQVLELYHAALEFITTERELEHAIRDAFEVHVGKFELTQMAVENKLAGHAYAVLSRGSGEALVRDHVLGEINGQPGLELIESTLDGELEKLRLEAHYRVNE